MGDRDQGSLSEFARPTLGSVKQRSRKGGQGRSSNGTSKAGTADPWSQASLELKRAYCSCVTDSGGSFTYINPECDRRFMTKLTHAFMPDVAHGIAQSFRHPILSTLDCKLDSVENLTTGELECKFLFDCKVKCLPNSFTDEPVSGSKCCTMLRLIGCSDD